MFIIEYWNDLSNRIFISKTFILAGTNFGGIQFWRKSIFAWYYIQDLDFRLCGHNLNFVNFANLWILDHFSSLEYMFNVIVLRWKIGNNFGWYTVLKRRLSSIAGCFCEEFRKLLIFRTFRGNKSLQIW